MSFPETEWNNLGNEQLGADQVLTEPTMNTLYSNVIATAQGAPEAPRVLSGYRREVFTSSGTFTIPSGVTRVRFWLVGGGGGGGAGGGDGTGSRGGDTSAFGFTARGGAPGNSGSSEGGVSPTPGAAQTRPRRADAPASAGQYEVVWGGGGASSGTDQPTGSDGGFGGMFRPGQGGAAGQSGTSGDAGSGGGGGGRSTQSAGVGGTGGAGGCVVDGYVNVTPGQQVAITVGSGGSGADGSSGLGFGGGNGGPGYAVIWW